jgi:hypothetical protein
MKYFHPFLVERVCSRNEEGATMNVMWQEKYREALLELRPEELPRRIEAAERAIQQRIEDEERSGPISSAEQQAIDDAFRGLRLLAKTECQTRRPHGPTLCESEVAS